MTKEEATWRCTHGWLRGEQCEICQSQPAQELVAWYDKHGMITHDPFEGVTPLYTTPQRKEWVGLTETEIDEWTP